MDPEATFFFFFPSQETAQGKKQKLLGSKSDFQLVQDSETNYLMMIMKKINLKWQSGV